MSKLLSLVVASALALACATASKPAPVVATGPAAAEKPECAEHTGKQADAPADAVATKAFDHKPKVGEKAICPVTDEKFVVGEDAQFVEYKGKWYSFCCDSCVTDFNKSPSLLRPRAKSARRLGRPRAAR